MADLQESGLWLAVALAHKAATDVHARKRHPAQADLPTPPMKISYDDSTWSLAFMYAASERQAYWGHTAHADLAEALRRALAIQQAHSEARP